MEKWKHFGFKLIESEIYHKVLTLYSASWKMKKFRKQQEFKKKQLNVLYIIFSCN